MNSLRYNKNDHIGTMLSIYCDAGVGSNTLEDNKYIDFWVRTGA